MTGTNNYGWYAAFKSKDTKFDGRFFVGVSSTGIYCRPVCRAKLPKFENCTFFQTAAEAEQAGYRPCLLCRPELAPGVSITDATASLVQKAALIIEENCANNKSLPELANRLGYTDRHLRRAFKAEYNVSPVQYLQTCRLLLAKNLLTDTNLSVSDAAMAAGFGSLRRFNDLFKKRYSLSPTALRKQTSGERKSANCITLTLCYRPPYNFKQMLSFLNMRAIPGVEVVKNDEYLRTVHVVTNEKKHIYGWVRIGNNASKNALIIAISESLISVLPHILAKVRLLFDLHCDPHAVGDVLEQMNDIRPSLFVLGTRLPGCFDPFELTVRAVLGQQITVKAARTLASRLASAYGTPIETGIDGLTHTFPMPEDIAALSDEISSHLGSLGIISARAKTISTLANTFIDETIDFGLCADPETEIEKLVKFPGIGSWTAKYIAMRTMGWSDAFLETDVAIKKALAPQTEKEMLALSEHWRPFRSYATINLWNSL
jgi:3-methyladenine DNA glycosylase/8-oxoguanine DNA glycosylase